MVPGSRLIDAPPNGLTVDQVAPLANDYEMAVLHTSTPSFANDAKFAAHLKEINPKIMIGIVERRVLRLCLQSRNRCASRIGSPQQSDYICADIAARKPLKDVGGIAYRDNGRVTFTPPRPTIENMDDLPFVTEAAWIRRSRLFHRLSASILKQRCVALYGPRMPVEVHVLLVAADIGRTPVPGAERGKCRGGNGAGEKIFPAGT